MTDRDYMLPSMQPIADAIGQENTRKIIRRHGGRSLYVKTTTDPDIASLIGIDAAKTLAETFGGQHLSIPLNKVSKREKIIMMLEAGMPVDKVAMILDTTENYVYTVKREVDL